MCTSAGSCQNCSVNYQPSASTAGNSSGFVCEECPTGQFSTGEGSSCSNCSAHCAECNDDSECTKCNAMYILTTNTTCELCETGTYSMSGDSECTACPDGCTACTALKCVSCQSGFTLGAPVNGSTGNMTMVCNACSDSEFSLGGTGECQTCPEGCATCNDTQNCMTCMEDYELLGNSTLCSKCTVGEYTPGGNEACSACADGCASCDNENTCLSCKPDYSFALIENSTTQATCTECNNGTFSLGFSATSCESCPTGCTLCTAGSSEAVCTECDDKFTLVDGVCLSCNVDYCGQCSV